MKKLNVTIQKGMLACLFAFSSFLGFSQVEEVHIPGFKPLSCVVPPTITCPTDFYACPGAATDPNNTGIAIGAPGDVGCSPPLVTHSDMVISTGPCTGATVIHRTWTATDPDNPALNASCLQTITLEDTIKPTIVGCPADMVVAANAGCFANVFWTPPTVSDNCGKLFLTVSHINGDKFPIGTTIVTYTVEDACENVSECSFSITVEGDCCDQAPIVTCPADYQGCPGDTILPKKLGLATGVAGSPECGAPVIQYYDDTISTGPCAGALEVNRYWTATDPNDPSLADTCIQNIVLEDLTSPVIAGCPADITVNSGDDCRAIVSWMEPTATDNCSNVHMTRTHAPSDTFNVGTTTVTYTFKDDCDNAAVCDFTVTVIEECCKENPIITCPSTFNGCPSTSTDPAITGTATAVPGSAKCDQPTIRFTDHVVSTGPCAGATVIERTWIAEDPNDATRNASCVQRIVLEDTVAPTWSNCPANITIMPNPDCKVSVTWTVPTASDNCGLPVITSTHNSGDTFMIGTTTVTYMAIDKCGNRMDCTFTVTVTDECCRENPTIACPNDFKGCPGASTEPALTGTATAAPGGPHCPQPNVRYTDHVVSTGPCAGATVIERTWIAEDPNDATRNASCVQRIVLEDTDAPTWNNCPANITVMPNPDCKVAVTWTVPTASDRCGLPIVTSTHSSGDTFMVGTTTVTYMAIDKCGNRMDCSFTVTVTDECCKEDPIITCPKDFSGCPGASTEPALTGTATAAPGGPHCPQPNIRYTDHVVSTGPCAGATVIERTWIAEDPNDATRNASCVQRIVLEDVEAPTWTDCPGNIEVSPNDDCEAIVSWTVPTASDRCGRPVVTSNHNPGDTFQIGTTTVVYMAIDKCGNRMDCSFTVTVKDECCNEPPLIICPGDFKGCPGVTQTGIATAKPSSPNCGKPSVTYTDQMTVNGPCDMVIIRTWTATDPDDASLTATCVQRIELIDDEAPLIKNCPSKIVVGANDDCEAIVNWTPPTATDNCGAVTWTSSHVPGTVFQVGTYTITYTATDKCGNKSVCSFTVIVDGDQINITCPGDIVIHKPGAPNGHYVQWTEPTVTQCGKTCPDAMKDFIYMGEYNGHRYFCSRSAATWDDAKAICTANGGHLAVIGSAGENSFLASKLMGQAAYIGYSDARVEGTFEWCNGDPTTYTNWYPGNPNNKNGIQDHVELLPSGQWNDQYYYIKREFICEVPCIDLKQIEGKKNGEFFPCGTSTVTYVATNDSGHTDTCSFTVTVECNNHNPYCDARGLNSKYMWIDDVQFANLKNWSGDNGGYADFTNLCADIDAGSSYGICLKPGFAATAYTVYWKIWIDYNMDGDFDDISEFVGYGSGRNVICGTLKIPDWCVKGSTRMRIAMAYGGYPGNSCCIFQYGEVEDYCINLNGAGFNGGGIESEIDPAVLVCNDCPAPTADLVPFDNGDNLIIRGDQDLELGSTMNITAFPNPVNERVTITWTGIENGQLEIIDIDGRTVTEKVISPLGNEVEIDTREWTPGYYHVRVVTSDGQVSFEKIIVNR